MERLAGMIWRDGDERPEEGVEAAQEEDTDPIQVERDAPRPATILKVAAALEERGGTILELFKEVESPLGRVVLPIYLRQDDRDFFVEVATGPWDDRKSGEALDEAAILRSSQHAGAELEILSGYPLPPEVEFYFGTSPAALLQLDLARLTPERPEVCAGHFREVGSNHWGVDLDYEVVEADADMREEVIRLSGQRAIPILTIGDEVLVDSTHIIRELRKRYA